MTWNNLKITYKLYFSFGVIMLLAAIVAFWSIIGIYFLINDSESMVKGNNFQSTLKQIYVDHLKWTVNLSEFVMKQNENELNIEKNSHNCAFGKWYYGDERLALEKEVPQLKELLNKIESPHEKLHQSAIKISEIWNSNDSLNKINAIQNIYSNETMKYLKEVGIILIEIIDVSGEHVLTDEHLVSQAKTTNYGVILIVIISTIITIIFVLIMTKGLVNPLKKGVDFSKKLADGDLTVKIDVHQKDEIGLLAHSMEEMSEKLKEVVIAIIANSENIASASNKLSQSSQEVSQGASEQAASVEQISSSMEEMGANIHQNSENAKLTEKIAIKAYEEIIKSNNNVNLTVEAMKKIADKISIITDIAFQTNILALNAAVEAARAGEHGKGFAVVASEVRKLAERSQIAANEINTLSKTSVEIAVKSGEMLNAIVPDIQKTSKLVQEISAASSEQSTGTEQINKAINQLNHVTQQNASSSEEMATSSEELSSQAEQLKDVITFFKI